MGSAVVSPAASASKAIDLSAGADSGTHSKFWVNGMLVGPGSGSGAELSGDSSGACSGGVPPGAPVSKGIDLSGRGADSGTHSKLWAKATSEGTNPGNCSAGQAVAASVPGCGSTAGEAI